MPRSRRLVRPPSVRQRDALNGSSQLSRIDVVSDGQPVDGIVGALPNDGLEHGDWLVSASVPKTSGSRGESNRDEAVERPGLQISSLEPLSDGALPDRSEPHVGVNRGARSA